MSVHRILFHSILLSGLMQLQPPALSSDVEPSSADWKLGDGTKVSEDDLIMLIAQHRQAVANYRGALTDYWQPFRGARLSGVDLADLVLRAASLHPVVYASSTMEDEELKDDELPLIDFSNAYLMRAEMTGLLFKGADFSGTRLIAARMVGVELFDAVLRVSDGLSFLNADLRNAGFVNVSAPGAVFFSTNLSGARFVNCNFEGAFFSEVRADSALFAGCNLTNAWLHGQFQHAALESTVNQDKRLVPTLVEGAIFGGNVEGLRWECLGRPAAANLARCENLHTFRNRSGGVELVLLRKYFSESGLEDARRKITYALRRQRIDDLWDGDSGNKPTLLERLEAGFEKLFFEWPSRFGMDRNRPLRLLVAVVFCFWLIYLGAVVLPRRSAKAGIWAIIAPDEGLGRNRARIIPVRLKPALGEIRRYRLRRLFRAVGISFAFSVQTAFALGYRDINVGAWLARVRSREYILRPTGWVRSVAGIQSLVCFYLVVIWVLSYFGHPFE